MMIQEKIRKVLITKPNNNIFSKGVDQMKSQPYVPLNFYIAK